MELIAVKWLINVIESCYSLPSLPSSGESDNVSYPHDVAREREHGNLFSALS